MLPSGYRHFFGKRENISFSLQSNSESLQILPTLAMALACNLGTSKLIFDFNWGEMGMSPDNISKLFSSSSLGFSVIAMTPDQKTLNI